jgi:hypothetical protein
MGDFLDKLKKAVDTGEFNSEAAKKINEIDKLADAKTSSFENVQDRLEKAGFKPAVGEEEAIELNSDYEKKMEEIKKQDAVNKQLATLIECEDMVQLSIGDMMTFITELESKFEKEFKEKDPLFIDLSLKIEEIKKNYQSIINKLI